MSRAAGIHFGQRWRGAYPALVAATFLVGGLTMLRPSLQPRSVRFFAAVPDLSADQAAKIYMGTSRSGWSPNAHALERVADGLYSAELDLEAGLALEYKFTRDGSWASVEKSADGSEIPNRRIEVDGKLDEQVLIHRIESWADRPVPARRRVEVSVPGGAATQPTSTLTGDIRYHYLVHSPQLKNARTVMVYVPPGYDDRPTQRYPVLYMQDGQNLFDAKTSFTGVEWSCDETAERLIEEGRIEPLIIVGVYNNADRMSEYSPTADARHGGGNADAYLEFLADTLKPFIDKQYRTRREREFTAIGGSSLGGLLALYALYHEADTFGRGAIVSPSLQWNDRAILETARRDELPRPVRAWVCMGTLEGRDPGLEEIYSEAVGACQALTEVWKSQGLTAESDYHLEIVEGGRHHEADWARRFDQILQFLFPRGGS